MNVDYAGLMLVVDSGAVTWSPRDVTLYALAIGMGSDPIDPADLPFVFERDLQAVPTFAGAMTIEGGAWPHLGLDFPNVLHGAHAITFHRPLPTSGHCATRSRISEAWDQGVGRAAVLLQEMELLLEPNGEKLATIWTTIYARTDGGFGGPAGSAPRQPIPDRAPDDSREYTTLPQQALLYRLTGDYNPLHADPEAARAAGFAVPILHGMCTYGISCRAVLDVFCGNDAALLRHHEARFSAPVYPGEALIVDMWRTEGGAAFQVRSKQRDIVVVDNGHSLIGPHDAV